MIELRNVQIVDSLSDETICFTADLWAAMDRDPIARVGTVKNAGQGGATLIHVTDPDVRRGLEARARSRCRPLPPSDDYPHEIAPPDRPAEALEWLVDQLLCDHIARLDHAVSNPEPPGLCGCGHVLDHSKDRVCRHCKRNEDEILRLARNLGTHVRAFPKVPDPGRPGMSEYQRVLTEWTHRRDDLHREIERACHVLAGREATAGARRR
jgi:hypothetical protein